MKLNKEQRLRMAEAVKTGVLTLDSLNDGHEVFRRVCARCCETHPDCALRPRTESDKQRARDTQERATSMLSRPQESARVELNEHDKNECAKAWYFGEFDPSLFEAPEVSQNKRLTIDEAAEELHRLQSEVCNMDGFCPIAPV